MPETSSKGTPIEVGRPTAGEEPPELADEWNRIFAMLWVIGTFVLVGGIVEDWLPKYVAVGVQCFAGGLVYFRFRDQRLRRFSLPKWLALVFLASVFASFLEFVSSRLWSALAKLWLLLFKS